MLLNNIILFSFPLHIQHLNHNTLNILQIFFKFLYWKEMFYLTTHSTHFILQKYTVLILFCFRLLYFVKTDITGCYDTIRQEKLYSIVGEILKKVGMNGYPSPHRPSLTSSNSFQQVFQIHRSVTGHARGY